MTINERIKAQDSSDEDEVDKEVAYLAKNFRRFLKFKRDGKSFEKENSQILRRTRKTSRRRIQKTPPHPNWSCALSAKGMDM